MLTLKSTGLRRLATRVATAAMVCLPVAAAASQGPGGGPGAAGHVTQLAMAILVYGCSALIVGGGLIGALRESKRP